MGQIGDSNRLSCVEDQYFAALTGPNIIESLYTKGIALYASFAITAFFVAFSFVVHFKKRGYNKALQTLSASSDGTEENTDMKVNGSVATLAPLQTAIKSGLAGFSFGSEFLLIVGLMKEKPHLGAVMIAF